ncbi:CS1 type fimbrial major subunit [Yersinia enterocolitica]|uniref:CS1 type fimbrial major subunit n=1 Tax=Yersinia enterocolitica TaxID=630 RepID=UPI0009F37DFB|nr:CS1 type fimbrial major subunit [Yersinia enterocolitica]PNM20759.1 hypothetical protein A6J65_019165 [Yersinia enterocolitica]HDL7733205.1 hypothetical protein [Yersinia enterocolitica]HDL8477741.1 hypothetical protein [Yersinia enterocolitica]
MKKTLLSIVTIAILASSSANAAPVEKDIAIEATVVSVIKLTKDSGSELDTIKMAYDPVKNDGHFTHTEQIKFTSLGGTKIKVSLSQPLLMNGPQGKTFSDYKIEIANQEVTFMGPPKIFNLVGNDFSGDLNVSAKQPKNASDGEVYKGVLKLSIEAEA